MKQYQTNKTNIQETRIVELDPQAMNPGEGEILARIDRFGFSANNITYAVAGDTLGYWKFFPPVGEDAEGWGVLPVWGFAEVEQSNVDGIKTGERMFGYFPPATHLVMKPIDVSADHFFDGTAHRAELPRGYNVYRRVEADPSYNPAGDDMQMLFFPLYVTSFALWDIMKEHDWYGAEQVIIVSGSSKTSIGLAYALDFDDEAPSTVALTSARNMEFVEGLETYDHCVSYDDIEQNIPVKPSTIVDMSGNADVLGRIHRLLGDNMMKTLNVGLTHWDTSRRNDDIIRDRSEFFFAPSQIQKRMKEWGPEEFGKRSVSFVMKAVQRSSGWLAKKPLQGVESLDEIYLDVLNGQNDPRDGYTIKV